MLSPDSWLEIWETVRKNKLRTALTGLAVAWGIFMLVVLLAAGTGLENGAQSNFKDDAVNSIWVFPGRTSIPHDGRGPGRRIQLRNGDHEAVTRQIDGVEHLSARFGDWGDQVTVRYGDQTGSFDVRAVHPAHRYLEKTTMREGRFLDDLDLAEKRKVVVIGRAVEDFLFRGRPAVGKELLVNGIAFRVIGTFEDVGGEGEEKKVYLPLSTAQLAFAGADRINMLMFTVGGASVEESRRIERETNRLMAERHGYAPDDTQALRVRNNLEQFEKLAQVFVGIRFVIWVIGIGTILAGIVGVSNIMLIAVKERTREFGVRKALGATPASIIRLVIQEAVVLTATAGYLGLLAAVALVELVDRAVPPGSMFADPEIEIGAALGATALLVVSGALAGFFPAWRAARVNPVEALRDE